MPCSGVACRRPPLTPRRPRTRDDDRRRPDTRSRLLALVLLPRQVSRHGVFCTGSRVERGLPVFVGLLVAPGRPLHRYLTWADVRGKCRHLRQVPLSFVTAVTGEVTGASPGRRRDLLASVARIGRCRRRMVQASRRSTRCPSLWRHRRSSSTVRCTKAAGAAASSWVTAGHRGPTAGLVGGSTRLWGRGRRPTVAARRRGGDRCGADPRATAGYRNRSAARCTAAVSRRSSRPATACPSRSRSKSVRHEDLRHR